MKVVGRATKFTFGCSRKSQNLVSISIDVPLTDQPANMSIYLVSQVVASQVSFEKFKVKANLSSKFQITLWLTFIIYNSLYTRNSGIHAITHQYSSSV
jgi:hypothetical protein